MPKPLLTKRRLALIEEVVREAFGLQQAGRYAQAEERYRTVLAIHPHHFDALHMLGLICYGLGRHAEALQLIGAALKVKAASADALSNHGLVLNALERYEEALASFDRALTLKPDYAEVLDNRGTALQRLGRTRGGACVLPARHRAQAGPFRRTLQSRQRAARARSPRRGA